jgi:hypothetical protein
VHKSEDLTRIFEGRHGPDEGTEPQSHTERAMLLVQHARRSMSLESYAQTLPLLQGSLFTADTSAPPSVILAASSQHLRAQKQATQRRQAFPPSHALCSTFATQATTLSPATRCTVRSALAVDREGHSAVLLSPHQPLPEVVNDVLQVARLPCSATSFPPRWASQPLLLTSMIGTR